MEGLSESEEPIELSLEDIRRLPRAEMVTELKCIEGWSQIVHWSGARFADFAAAHKPAERASGLRDREAHRGDWVRL